MRGRLCRVLGRRRKLMVLVLVMAVCAFIYVPLWLTMRQQGGGELVLFTALSLLPRWPRVQLMRAFTGTRGDNVVYYRDPGSRQGPPQVAITIDDAPSIDAVR